MATVDFELQWQYHPNESTFLLSYYPKVDKSVKEMLAGGLSLPL